MTNILNRYGRKNNLTFALPKGGSLFDWPRPLKTNRILTVWKTPHILCNHARYTKKLMHYLFPKDQSKYLTIIRHPLTQYESTFNYMKLWRGLGIEGNDSMEILQKYLLKVTTVKSAKLNLKDRSRLLRNPMIYDLGLDFRYYQDFQAVKKYIEFLEKEYELVMIMEYFEESVVLLKRLYCWEWDDVVYIKHNERQEKEKIKLSKLLKLNLESWNQADFMLYDHFNKTLWKKIAAEGTEFYEDLAHFRMRQKEVFSMCVGKSLVKTQIYIGKFVNGYGLKKDIPKDKKDFCVNLLKSELQFHSENTAAANTLMKQLEKPEEFENEFGKENDWDLAKDLAHHPVRSLPTITTENTPSPNNTH